MQELLHKERAMFLKQCNINKTDRINRAVIGVVLFIAALIGMSKVFFMVVGLILMIEGMIGWCSIPYLMNKIKVN
jgi:disulfide bond formation protein DsbB